MYKKISSINLKDDLLKEIYDKVTPLSFLTTYGIIPKIHLMTGYKKKCLNGVQAGVFSSIKPLISFLESSKNGETKTPITSVMQNLCSFNLDISRLHRVLAVSLFKPELHSRV